MTDRLIMLITLVAAAAPLWAVDNPNVGYSVGEPTAVPSASRSGLTPNRPFSTSGSGDIITGNIGGLRHFRGVLPYTSGYYSDTTAFSPVDDFLRRSYDPVVHDRSPGLARPYFEPRRTMTSSIRADGSGLFSPAITDQGQTDPYVPPMLAQTFDTQYRRRPLSLSGSEVERLMSVQMQLREEMERERLEAEGQDPSVVEDIRKDSPFFQDYLRAEELTPLPVRPEKPDEEPEEEEESELLPEEQVLEALRKEREEAQLEDSPERISELLRPRTDAAGPENAGQPELTPEEAARLAAEKSEVSAMLSRYGDFERLAKARVAEYIAAAEAFLKEGKYYKAADAFALAAIWGPQDVRPFVGQAVSLFAAGEYMSSAYLLRQAIINNPKVASEKITVSALIGDRDVYENRLIEMATWQQRSGSGELAFLIAYLLHHDEKTRGAAEAVRFAAEQMSDDKAVQILRDAILPNENK